MNATTTILKEASPSLEAAQKAVGGPVEMVTLRDGRQVLVNEEGLWLGLPVNYEASALCGRVIVGNALVLEGKARWR